MHNFDAHSSDSGNRDLESSSWSLDEGNVQQDESGNTSSNMQPHTTELSTELSARDNCNDLHSENEIDLIGDGGSAGQVSQSPASASSADYSFQLLRVGVPLWFSDACSLQVALLVSWFCISPYKPPINHFASFSFLTILAYSFSYGMGGLYPGVGVHPAQELRQLFRGSVTATLAILIGLGMVVRWTNPYISLLIVALPFHWALLPISRSLVKSYLRRFRLGVPFYFLGSREDVFRVYEDMARFGWTMLRPIGRYSPEEANSGTSDASDPHYERCEGVIDSAVELRFERQVPDLGPAEELSRARNRSVCWLFVVGEPPAISSPSRIAKICRDFPEVVWIRPEKSQACAGGTVLSCGLASGIRVEESLLKFWPRIQKRALDLTLSVIGICVLFPVLATLALLVRLSGKGPIFYGSTRIGQNGRSFRAWKFRSMVDNADEVLEQHLQANPQIREEWLRNHKLKKDPRITTVGRILRKTSLDEIPQLWNVILGEMSLVGPRPILPDEIKKFGHAFEDYTRVRPGITGLWQVSGRNKTAYEDRLVYSSFYVRHWTPWLDLYILLRTIKTVLLCEGAY